MMLPIKKHPIALATASAGIFTNADMGKAGFEVTAGRMKPENWSRERRKIYVVIGTQSNGTTYHSVTVTTYTLR